MKGGRPLSRFSRACRDGLLGGVLALGAPLGLIVMRLLEAGGVTPGGIEGEVLEHPWTYAYVALSTLVAFSAFGYLLGRQADRLYELSHSDPLTGLRNRRAFEGRLGEELQRALRYHAQLSVLLLDVDGLKRHNDRLGHRAGDEALVRVAAGIRNGSRQTDVAARWGGDEFAILAPSTGRDEALQLAERVREQAAFPEIGLSVSVGVATLEESLSREPEALIRAADAALYEAKRRGRNRVVAAPWSGPTDGAYTPAP